jgi:ABC-type phosphate transport system substrate-binding protein
MTRLIFLVVGMLLAVAAHADRLAIIANPAVPVKAISLEELTLIYLAEKKSWPDGTPVVPVNREPSSKSREYFSEQVFNRTPADMSQYWNRLLYVGKIPPLVQNSDAAILGFVRKVPGAIGYVNASPAPTGVKVLMELR